MFDSEQSKESKRLAALIPDDLFAQIAIAEGVAAPFAYTPGKLFSKYKRNPLISLTNYRLSLISSKRLDRKHYQIEIDFNAWQKIDLDYRNLLFWHEVVRIQQHSFPSERWQLVVFTTGLAMSILEINSQQVLLLAIYLLLTILAGWQLYQNHRGENHLRAATQADQGAILLAQQFGYSLPRAYSSLRGGIKILLERSPKSFLTKEYQTRWQVLEINAIKHRKKTAIF